MSRVNNESLFLLLLITIIIIESFFFRLLSNTYDNFIFQWMIIIFNIIVVLLILLKNKYDDEKRINAVIFFSFLIRNILLIMDIYGYTSGFTGADTEVFYKSATGMMNFGHNYVVLLKIIVLFLGKSRIVLEYVNVILSFFSMLIMKKILLIIYDGKIDKIIYPLLIFCFAPANMLISASLLRETWMIFLNLLSFYFFIRWYKENKISQFVFACIFIALSSWLHSGMIFALLGYSIVFVIYNHRKKSFSLNKNFIVSIVIIMMFMGGILVLFGNSITSYFNKINSIDDIASKTAIGNTDYLTFLDNTNNSLLMLVCTPLKAFYFYCSPMIWSCRSFNVLLVFLFSSSIYLYLFYYILKYRNLIKTFVKSLLIILVFLSLVYAWGTCNAGTAMRHREKIFPLIVIIYGSLDCVRRKNDEKEKDKGSLFIS